VLSGRLIKSAPSHAPREPFACHTMVVEHHNLPVSGQQSRRELSEPAVSDQSDGHGFFRLR
jgi:hypothetical protein